MKKIIERWLAFRIDTLLDRVYGYDMIRVMAPYGLSEDERVRLEKKIVRLLVKVEKLENKRKMYEEG